LFVVIAKKDFIKAWSVSNNFGANVYIYSIDIAEDF
tara:strand:- start:778 stop:885 length:108 start_codon:yes stop_codon:yes gene_type:complete